MSRCVRALGRVAVAAIAGAYAAVGVAHADALRAAGVNGSPPANAGAIRNFVSAITDNALWLIGTVATLGILVIGALFFFGHTRAADYAAKIAVGAVIIVSAPGIAA